MHILVTDRLACPRCGPGFGLILLADRLEERRVLDGVLGCANCRERYPVHAGFGDLRPPPREELTPTEPPGGGEPEDSFRLAALLGITSGPGLVLLSGRWAGHAERLAGMIEEIEVLAAHPGLLDEAERPGVSRIMVGSRLPFFSGALRGAVVEGDGLERGVELEEVVRVLVPGARIVVSSPQPGAMERLEGLGMEPLLETTRFVVAARS
jgi:uncharacterized protein YbaR (Trm112 family)